MKQERKRRAEEHENSLRSVSVGKRVLSKGFIPGRFTEARARSAPRQREDVSVTHFDPDARSVGSASVNHQSHGTEKFCARSPGKPKSAEKCQSRPSFRPGGSSGGDLFGLSTTTVRPRSQSAPRERTKEDAGRSLLPAHERLFNLAQKGHQREVHEKARSPAQMPWSSGGTHWERAERQRKRLSSSAISFRLERSHLNRTGEEHDDAPIHERLYKESYTKSDERREKAEAKRKEQEVQDWIATRRRPLISARSKELLADKHVDDETHIYDRLYERGIEKSEERQRIHEEKLKRLEAEALLERQSKFMPAQTVQPFQPDLPRAVRVIKRDDAWVDRVDTLVEQRKQQEEANRLAAELHEISQCTFCPEISKFASQHGRDTKGHLSVHDALFEDARKSRDRSCVHTSPPHVAKKVSREEEEVVNRPYAIIGVMLVRNRAPYLTAIVN